MLEPLDRLRRDPTLLQFTAKQLRDIIDPKRAVIQIDEQLDFAKLTAPLEERCCPDFGRPAIHPELSSGCCSFACSTTSPPSVDCSRPCPKILLVAGFVS